MVYSACIFRPKCWERAGYSSAHRGKVYFTKVLLSVTEEDRRCPEGICSVDPNSSDPIIGPGVGPTIGCTKGLPTGWTDGSPEVIQVYPQVYPPVVASGHCRWWLKVEGLSGEVVASDDTGHDLGQPSDCSPRLFIPSGTLIWICPGLGSTHTSRVRYLVSV